MRDQALCLAADFFAAGLAADLALGLAVALLAALAPKGAGFLIGFRGASGIAATGTESRRVGVLPALTVAFFLATGLRTGSAGLGAPNFKRTGLSPQISSRL